MKVVIDHLRGHRRGQRQEFSAEQRLSIGRHPANDIVFDGHRDLDASARHAELRRQGRGYVIRDVGSSNGTFIDGKTIAEHTLASGQSVVIEFGSGGPVLFVWVGPDDDEPGPAPKLSTIHSAPRMWARARASARRSRSLAGVFVFAAALAREVAYRSSWRFRGIALLILGAIIALLALHFA